MKQAKKNSNNSYNNDHNLLNYSTHMCQSENTGDNFLNAIFQFIHCYSLALVHYFLTVFLYPNRKKHSVRSGRLARHSCVPCRLTQRLGKIWSNHSQTVIAILVGAPSCIKMRSPMFFHPDIAGQTYQWSIWNVCSAQHS